MTSDDQPTIAKKTKLLRHAQRFSKAQLLVFVIFFGIIGGYVLYRSFAAAPLIASLQAEQMSNPGSGVVYNDAKASGGKARAIYSNGTTTGSVSFPSAVNSITIVARGSVCGSNHPTMAVSVDDKSILSTGVTATAWTGYSVNDALAAGSHTLSIKYSGDYYTKKCDVNLYLDVSNFYGPIPVSTPAPTVALSAMPNSLTAGSASTLTWGSTNATSCTASGAWSGAQNTTGSVSTGALNQNSTYNLACTGPGGSGSATATVQVVAATNSPNNTVVNGTSGKIVDANGHIWTITTGGQVAVDGTVDSITSSVIELAYESGKVWQLNSYGYWWYKIVPTDTWLPNGGTTTSPVPGAAGGSGSGDGGSVTSSSLFFGTINNLSGGGSEQNVLNIGAKWVREDNASASVISWAHSNGIKVLDIIYNNPNQNCTADAYELDNEPWTPNGGNVNPTTWAQQARAAAIAIRSACPGKPILLPLLVYGPANIGDWSGWYADNKGDYQYPGGSGPTEPWVTWINNATPDIWQYVDGFSVHPYYEYGNFSILDSIRNQLNAIANTAGKPYWITELGYATSPSDVSGSEASQATNLQTDINAIKARKDIQAVFFYRLDDISAYSSGSTDSEQYYGAEHTDGSHKPAWAVEHAVF